MRYRTQAYILILLTLCIPLALYAKTDNVGVSLTITAICNNDGSCDGHESVYNCPVDCKTGGSGDASTPTVYPPVAGCTNPAASNYNSAATSDDGSCRTVYGVTGFAVSGNAGALTASLKWKNPSNQAGFTFNHVRIIRKTTLPNGPNDGVLVYEGSGTSATDLGLYLGIRYYYAAYVYSNAGDISGPALVSVLLATPSAEPPINDSPESESSGEHPAPQDVVAPQPFDIFDTFPEAKLQLKGPVFAVKVIQQNDIKKFLGGDVSVYGDLPITFSIDYDLLPEVLKTVGITIFDPDTTQTASFVLHADRATRAYRTTIGTFDKPGRYPITLHIFDYENRQMKKIYGTLVVTRTMLSAVISAVTHIAIPVVIGIGIIAGVLRILLILSPARPLYAIYILVLRFFGALFGIIALKRRTVPQGTDGVNARREIVFTQIFTTVYMIGFVSAFVLLIIQPSMLTIAVVIVYMCISKSYPLFRS